MLVTFPDVWRSSREVGRHTRASWANKTPMCIKVTFGSTCHIRLRRGDNVLLFVSIRQSPELTIPGFLSVLHVGCAGDRQTIRYEVIADCDFWSDTLWTKDDPEFLAYRDHLHEFYEYRDQIMEGN